MIQELPPEIIDEIMEYFREDLNTLKSCSLVCKSLQPSAQPHIFSTLHVTKKTCLQNVKLFVISPHLAKYVRKLEIIPYHLSPHSGSVVTWLDEFIPILEKFHNVDHLVLHLLALNLISPRTKDCILNFARNARHLHLERVSFTDYEDIASLIVSSKNLASLTLHMNGGVLPVRSLAVSSRPKPEQMFPRHLKQLSIIYGRWRLESYLLNHLLLASRRITVEYATIPLSLPASSDFLEVIDDSLLGLNIELDKEFDTKQVYAQEVIKYLASTRSLTCLGLEVRQEQDGSELECLSHIRAALEGLSQSLTLPASLQTLKLHITAERPVVAISSDWSAIDGILHEHFTSLSKVLVRLRIKRHKPTASQTVEGSIMVKVALESQLHNTLAAGKLEIVSQYYTNGKWVGSMDHVLAGRQEGSFRSRFASVLGMLKANRN